MRKDFISRQLAMPGIQGFVISRMPLFFFFLKAYVRNRNISNSPIAGNRRKSKGRGCRLSKI